MSACCSTYGNVADAHFDEKIAKRDLDNYRKKGNHRGDRSRHLLLPAFESLLTGGPPSASQVLN